MSRNWPHRFVGTHEEPKRTPYKGHRDPGSAEMGLAGYETLKMADVKDPFEAEDREIFGTDADYDITKVR